MRPRITRSGLAAVESRNSRRERMRSWKAKRDPMARQLEERLRELDPRTEVDFVEPAEILRPASERAPGVQPGRWHIIIRTARHLDDYYFPITGEGGVYREPDSGVIEEMKARDLWRPYALRKIREEEERELAKRQRAEQTESEARVEQVAAAYRAAKRVPGDGGEKRRLAGKGGERRSKGGVVLPAGAEA